MPNSTRVKLTDKPAKIVRKHPLQKVIALDLSDIASIKIKCQVWQSLLYYPLSANSRPTGYNF